jgi:hypothetical protein
VCSGGADGDDFAVPTTSSADPYDSEGTATPGAHLGAAAWSVDEAARSRDCADPEPAGEGICGVDQRGTIEFINPAGARLPTYLKATTDIPKPPMW